MFYRVFHSRYFRPTEIKELLGDSAKAKKVLGWESKVSIEKIAEIVNCPVINAGEGINEHPTQALLDAYTIINNKRKENYDLYICTK